MGQVFGSFVGSAGSSMMPSASGSQSFSSGRPATVDTQSGDDGRTFVQMVKEHETYGPLLKVSTTYEMNIVHRAVLQNLHWYILVRAQNSE